MLLSSAIFLHVIAYLSIPLQQPDNRPIAGSGVNVASVASGLHSNTQQIAFLSYFNHILCATWPLNRLIVAFYSRRSYTTFSLFIHSYEYITCMPMTRRPIVIVSPLTFQLL